MTTKMFEHFHPGFIFFLVGLFACVGSENSAR